jgi:hypothetical protein
MLCRYFVAIFTPFVYIKARFIACGLAISGAGLA